MFVYRLSKQEQEKAEGITNGLVRLILWGVGLLILIPIVGFALMGFLNLMR